MDALNQFVLPLLIAILGSTQLFTWLGTRRKSHAEASATEAAAAEVVQQVVARQLQIVTEHADRERARLHDEIEHERRRFEAKVGELKEEVRKAEEESKHLRHQLRNCHVRVNALEQRLDETQPIETIPEATS